MAQGRVARPVAARREFGGAACYAEGDPMMLLLLACTPANVIALGHDSAAPAGVGGGTAVLPGTDGNDNEDDGDGDDDEPAPDSDEALWDCADIFEQDRLREYRITLERQVWRAIQTEYSNHDGSKGYHEVESFEMDGESVQGVSIRLKGNEGYSWVGTKMQFVLSFVEVDENQRFHGQRHVAFDATWYDHTLMNNRLAARFLRRMGQPAPCANHARLTINDEYFGLYAHMEQLDREYLERNFGDDAADGNLYKYGYELKNNEGADTSRMQSFWSDYSFDHISQLGDPDQWVAEWAAEAAMPDWDGYWYSGHNYYLYDHPEQGLMYLPWDLDATFSYYHSPFQDPFSLYWDYVPHLTSVLSQPEYEQRFVERIQEYAEAWPVEVMEQELAAWEEQTRASLEEDPNKTYTMAEHDAAVALTLSGLGQRRDFLVAWAEARLGR